MSAPKPLRALCLAVALALPVTAWGQETPEEALTAGSPTVAGPGGASAPDTAALVQAEAAGRLAAALEENDRLRSEMARLREDLGAARARVASLTDERRERALATAGAIALASALVGMILGRASAGRRRRGGF
jgi:hypothetical protein